MKSLVKYLLVDGLSKGAPFLVLLILGRYIIDSELIIIEKFLIYANLIIGVLTFSQQSIFTKSLYLDLNKSKLHSPNIFALLIPAVLLFLISIFFKEWALTWAEPIFSSSSKQP